MVGAVENSPNTCTNDSCYFYSTWWLYILDRQGRVVWYYADGTSTDVSSFPQIARDGEYLFVEKRNFNLSGTPSVLKMTLDRETYSASVTVPDLSDGVDMTSDGTLLYDTEERTAAQLRAAPDGHGGDRHARSGSAPRRGFNNCYSNIVSWDPATDTVLLSFPEANTIAQIDRKTGTLVATYGSATGSYAFSPSPWSFVWQHFPNITPQGTLLVSTHLPQYTKDSAGRAEPARIRGVHDRSHEQAADADLDLRRQPPATAPSGRRRAAMALRLVERQHAGQLRHRRRHSRGDARQEDRLLREVRHHRRRTTTSTGSSATTSSSTISTR